ncbi:MAG TPA: hypothetical protein VMS17_09350 [Gemmataceae bacterium]|nr:hypothetical protein [Gemmataceae bacterium]
MTSAEVLVLSVTAVLTAVVAFALYKWLQRQRVSRITKWVKDYLFVRFGGTPNRLTINCSDDPLWPVLAAFDDPRTGVQHRLQFICAGPASTFLLLSELEESR